MAARQKDVRLFQRAADQRLTTAAFLLEHGYHLDAVYLAGYGVECALKSLILQRTPERGYAPMRDKITRGKGGHDFETLIGVLARKPLNCMIPKDVREMLRRVTSWSTDLRYQAGFIKYAEARRFLVSAEGIRNWAQRS